MRDVIVRVLVLLEKIAYLGDPNFEGVAIPDVEKLAVIIAGFLQVPLIVFLDRTGLPLPPQDKSGKQGGHIVFIRPVCVPRLFRQRCVSIDHVHCVPNLVPQSFQKAIVMEIASRRELCPYLLEEIKPLPSPVEQGEGLIEIRRQDGIHPDYICAEVGYLAEPFKVGPPFDRILTREISRKTETDVHAFDEELPPRTVVNLQVVGESPEP